MDAVGRVADEHIAHRHRRRIDEIWLLRTTDAETGKLDHIHRHDSRHFRRFATSEDAVASLKIVRHPGNEAGDFLFMQRRDADVVEEKQRIATGGEDVIHAHRDEVLARRLEQIVLQ